mmetsp:Transcript_32735/g.101351  ORF Transcript_32735/g.101351 Transcript_32735/m.101351 type:complete len:86 (-) Transcript_32735:1702-1959(-)
MNMPVPAAAVRVGGGNAAARARQLSSGRGHDGGGKGPALDKNRVCKRDGRGGGVFFFVSMVVLEESGLLYVSSSPTPAGKVKSLS